MVLFEPCRKKTCLEGFPTRSHTNRAVQAQKMAQGLKFQRTVLSMKQKKKGTDQLHGYDKADLCICFCI